VKKMYSKNTSRYPQPGVGAAPD